MPMDKIKKAERDRRYRERKKLEKEKQAREGAGTVSGSPDMGVKGKCESCPSLDLQAPIPQYSELDLQADAERYRAELMPEPVLDDPDEKKALRDHQKEFWRRMASSSCTMESEDFARRARRIRNTNTPGATY